MSNKTLTLSSRALRGLTATALVCAALSGCGGGDGAETADTYFPPSVRVVGQVVGKDGALLASGTVQAYDALGAACAQGGVQEAGRYRIDLAACTPPTLLLARDGSGAAQSLTLVPVGYPGTGGSGAARVNLSPLTTAVADVLLGQPRAYLADLPAQLRDQVPVISWTRQQAALASLRTLARDSLGVTLPADPLTGEISGGLVAEMTRYQTFDFNIGPKLFVRTDPPDAGFFPLVEAEPPETYQRWADNVGDMYRNSDFSFRANLRTPLRDLSIVCEARIGANLYITSSACRVAGGGYDKTKVYGRLTGRVVNDALAPANGQVVLMINLRMFDDVWIDEIPLVARLARYPMLHMWPNSISTDPRSNPRVYTLSGGTGDVVMPEE
ncbi:MAG: hypothetical protein Fur0019_13710 [Tibeticola sp.]